MTIDELIKKAHAQAKSMGWWDEPRNTGELLMLIVSECGEALEAHRDGKRASLAAFEMEYMAAAGMWDAGVIHNFKCHIKDTLEDELADIVIRIADLAGAHGLSLPVPDKVQQLASVYSHKNVGNALLGVVKSVSSVGNFGNAASDEEKLAAAIIGAFSIAADHNIDLWHHIELKLAYNLTRGRKHGKAY